MLNMSLETEVNYSLHRCFLNEYQMDKAALEKFSFLVEGVFSSIVATIGVSGNLASIFVLVRPNFKETFHKLLICLSIVDSVFILCASCSSWIRITKPVKIEEGSIVEGHLHHLLFLFC